MCSIALCVINCFEFSLLDSSQLLLTEARTCFHGFQRLGHHTGYWVLVYYKVGMKERSVVVVVVFLLISLSVFILSIYIS